MITAEKIKELRDKTGISVMSCKKALEEAEGDMVQAVLLLKKQGVKVAEKKSDRELKAGIVQSYIHSNKQIGVLIEAKSETDFVAKNEAFQSFVHDIAMHIAASEPKNGSALLEQPYIKNPDISIKDYLNEMIQKFGENIEIVRFTRYEISKR